MKKTSLGIGFSDNLASLSGNRARRKRNRQHGMLQESSQFALPTLGQEPQAFTGSAWRSTIILLLVVLFVTVLTGRLVQLQIFQGSGYRLESDANRLVVKTIHAPRGIIYDRNNVPLVKNVPAFVRVMENRAEFVSYEEALQMEATAAADDLEIQAQRNYIQGESYAHVLGYTSEISKEELADPKLSKFYALGDRIGRSGLELMYEDYLRGVDGAVFTEVSATKNTKRQVATTQPLEGKSLQVGIDNALQRKSYDVLRAALEKLGAKAGVVVAQDPKTGEILALVSLPTYDNNIFSANLKQAEYETLLNDPNQPLFDRVVSGAYPPGSIYKIITSIAGFNTGKLQKSTRVVDTGVIQLGAYSFPNWLWLSQGKTEGELDIVKALARSNDIFFYRVGEWVGPESLAQWARKAGMGKPTGIDLPGELPGLVPDKEWKKRYKQEIWYPGDTYHVAIGQGDNLQTPIQLNMLTALVANKGIAKKPHVVTKILDNKAKVIKSIEPKTAVEDIVSQPHLALIKQGMKAACSEGGTGWPFFNFGIPELGAPLATESAQASSSAKIAKRISVGCKTGTAEFGQLLPSAGGGRSYKTHAWFTVFAPYDDPEIAMTVLVEAGGEGSNVAAPVAKEILTWYFSRTK